MFGFRTGLRSPYYTLSLSGLLVLVLLNVSGCVTTNEATLKPVKMDKSKEQIPTAQTLYALSRLYVVQEEEKKAEAVLVRIIAEYPGFSPAYSDLARLRVKQGRVEESIGLLTSALSINENDPVLHNNLGLSELLNANYEGALTHFESARKIDPNKTKYQANIALAYGLMGNTEQCYVAYRDIMSEEDTRHNIGLITTMRESRNQKQVIEGFLQGIVAEENTEAATPENASVQSTDLADGINETQ